MTETDYITATNLAKIVVISNVIRDIMDGDDYGVNSKDYVAAVVCLDKIQTALFKKVKITEGVYK